jgi:ABC-type polysaccharide/polyol phosphate export permease
MISSLKQIYNYRALLWALVTRHLAIRYRGSVLGFLWSLLNPLLLMLVYSLVFKYYVRLQGVEHYSVFMFTGLLPWLWLTSSLTEATSSIVGSGHLITKSMFPAQILPLVPVITNCINLLLSLPLLFVFMLWGGVPFHWTLVFLPVLILVQFFTLQGIGVLLGSLNVFYRDIQHILGNALTFVFFLCPILYTPATVPDQFKFSLDFNPLAQLTMGYHSLIMEGQLPSVYSICFMLGFMVISMAAGYWVYSRNQESLSELL